MPQPLPEMKAGPAAYEIVKHFEGLRLTAYPDPEPNGRIIWTIGWGHTEGVTEGMVATPQQADAWLHESDMPRAERAVREIGGIAQNQFDALCSFTYNIGDAALRASTLCRKLRYGFDAIAAGRELLRWIYDDGKIREGLQRRRACEHDLYTSGGISYRSFFDDAYWAAHKVRTGTVQA